MEDEVTYQAIEYQGILLDGLEMKISGLLKMITEKQPESADNNNRRARCIQQMIEIIKSFNRSFMKLLQFNEPITALALIRLQMDNAKCLFAEMLYPNKILHKIYENGRELGQIKIKGKSAASSEIIGDLIDGEPFCELWHKYSKFVHPDREQSQIQVKTEFIEKVKKRKEKAEKTKGTFSYTDDDVTIIPEDKNKLSRDMMLIVQIIEGILLEIVADLEHKATELGIPLKEDTEYIQMRIDELTDGTGWY